MNQPRSTLTPYFLVLLGAAFVLPLTLVLAKAMGAGNAWTVILMGLAITTVGWAAFGRAGQVVDTSPVPTGTRRLAWSVALLGAFAFGGVGLYIAEPDNDRFVWHHHQDFGIKHNCFTCYAMAAHCDAEGYKNVYDTTVLRSAEKTTPHKTLDGRYNIDAYPYPPPFLLTQKVLLLFSHDFWTLRRLWFLVVALSFGAALLGLVHWAGGWHLNHGLLFLPVIFLAPSTLTAFQIQNVHPLVVILAVTGAALLARNRNFSGSLLLSFAILAKMWPAALLAPFVFAGRWRAVASTVLSAASFTLIALMMMGTGIFDDFLSYQLPRLASGEAFGFMVKHAGAMTANTSVFGFWHKLQDLTSGSPGGTLLPKALAWGYLAFAGLLILWSSWSSRSLLSAAFKDNEAGHKARLVLMIQWLAILTLAQLRSPFLPWPYGVLSTQLLFLAWAALAGGRTRIMAILGLVYFSMYIPFSFASKNVDYVYGMVGTMLMLAVSAWSLVHVARSPHSSAA